MSLNKYKLYHNNNKVNRMKNLNPIRSLVVLLLSILISSSASAQLDTCNVFLKGNYIEVGIAPNGGFGSTKDAPLSYVARPVTGTGGQNFYNPCDTLKTCASRRSIGFIADPDKDGYLTGSPSYYGDYFVPGYPQEGWSISMNGSEATAYTGLLGACPSTGFAGAAGLSGSNVSYTNLGKEVSGLWVGQFTKSSTEKLAITQTTTIDTSTVYFVCYVTLKNVGTATLNNIYYMRTLDPDNDVTISGDYTTRNVVSYKIPNPQNKAAVSTWGIHYTKAFCGLGTEDCRAMAFVNKTGLTPTSSSASIYNHTAGSAVNYDSSVADEGVGLIFSIGTLAAGDSTAIAYAYVLNINELDSAFAATKPKWANSGDSATLKGGDTAHVCRNTVSTINITHGGAYNWTWTVSPASTVISTTTGPTVSVNVGTSTVYLRAIGTSPACFTDTLYVTLKPDKVPAAPPAKSIVYCQGDVPSKLTTSGSNLLWYTTDTGGVGTIVAPTPGTSVPGTYNWWVTQTIKGCESDRTKMTVTVHPGSVDSFAYQIVYGCDSDLVNFTDYSTGVIVSHIWDFGDGKSDTVTNPSHFYTKQGTYTVKLTTLNNYNCQYKYSTTFTISHPQTVSASLSPDTICEFKNIKYTGTATGKAPLSYFWDFGDGATATTLTANHFYSNTGVFKVIFVATDSIGCHDTAIKYASIDTFASANFTASDDNICVGKTVTFNGDYSALGNIGAVWTFGDGSLLKDQKNPRHAFDRAGTYTVTLTAKYRQCPDTIVTKDIIVHGLPVVNLGPDTSLCSNSGSITLSDNVNASNPSATWLWNTGATTPSITVTQYGLYYATVKVDGCTNMDSVNVKNDCYLSLPNAFTPNDDGLDDYFFPRQFLTSGATAFTMDIYDRWGQLIFRTDNINGRGWDGRFNGVKQPSGVYVYLIDVAFKNGVKQHYQGNVTLLR